MLASPPLLYFHTPFSAFTIYKLQNLPLWKFHTSPFEKIFVRWYREFVHIYAFMGIHETINNNQEDLKKYVCVKFYPLTAFYSVTFL